MILKNYFFLAFVILLAFTSCKKSSVNPPIHTQTDTIPTAQWPAGTDVYFVGTVTPASPSNSPPTATIWKNGVATSLPNTLSPGLDDEADAVAISGGDVYVAGKAHIGSFSAACYWKNGVITKLKNGDSQASAIAVDGSDIYMAGHVLDVNGAEAAAYWKNDALVTIQQENISSSSQANAITVVNGDVYLAGLTYNQIDRFPVACYWKNGVLTKLSANVRGSEANAIMVVGGHVYTAGYDNQGAATLWKDSTATTLNGGAVGANALALATNGTDIYVAGLVGGVPVYWKNGTITTLPGDQMTAQNLCMALSGTDVYVAGGLTSNNNAIQPIFWKNGVAAKFGAGIAVIAGVAVVPH